MSLKESIEAARLRVGAWNRERKERAAEKRAQRPPPVPGAAPLVWVWFLAFIAFTTLVGSTWMLFVFIAGSVGAVDWAFDWRAGNDGEPARWVWFARAQIHALIAIGLGCFCLGIAAFNAVWLHILHLLSAFWKRVVIPLGIATALFMVSGAIVTQQWGTVARERDEIVATNTARQGVVTVQAEIDAIETEMTRLCAPALTTWQAQACRSGTAAWTRRIEIARQQGADNFDIIERAIADAEQGDAWRARLLTLRQEAAVARVDTVEAEAQQAETTGWMTAFARTLEEVRKPFIAVLGELLAMTMFGVALAAAHSRRPYAVHPSQSGWARDDRQIEDLRDDEPVTPKPMRPAREVVTDAETGEELIRITPKPHWRKQKGRKQRVETAPDPLPDETGVEYDGGERQATSGVTIGGVFDPASVMLGEDNVAGEKHADAPKAEDGEPVAEASQEVPQDVSQPELSEEPPPLTELSEEQVNELLAEAAEVADVVVNESDSQRDGEEHGEHGPEDFPENIEADFALSGVAAESPTDKAFDHETLPEREEPETDPAKMIPANVAAE